MVVPNEYLIENPSLFCALRQDIISNARFLWGAEIEYDVITAFENKTSNIPDEVYDGERGADQFEVSLVGYQVKDKGKMEGKVMLESMGHGQLDAMHLLAIGMQSMVKNSKRAKGLTLGDTFSGVNYKG